MPANRTTIGAAVLASLALLASTAAATTAATRATSTSTVTTAHPARHLTTFRGRVTSSSHKHGWFQMRTTANKTVRIYTNPGTHWNGCDWDDMGHGHHVHVQAYRNHGHWIASMMQNWSQWGNRGWGDMPGWMNGGWGMNGHGGMWS